MMGNTGIRTVVLAVAAVAVAACTTAPKQDVVDTIAASGNHKTLTQAIKASGLESTLREKGPVTVLAPTDDAFALLPKPMVDSLMKPENKAQLAKVLQYHVIPGNNSAETLTRTDPIARFARVQSIERPATPTPVASITPVQSLTANGGNVSIFNHNIAWKTAANAEVTVGRWWGSIDSTWVNSFARVVKADIAASNGVVHSIDRVLLPR